jgi:hypothetical protein
MHLPVHVMIVPPRVAVGYKEHQSPFLTASVLHQTSAEPSSFSQSRSSTAIESIFHCPSHTSPHFTRAFAIPSPTITRLNLMRTCTTTLKSIPNESPRDKKDPKNEEAMLDRLPNELLCNIVLLLPQNDQAKLTCINKHIHELAESVRYQDVDLEGGQEQLFSLVNRILLDIKILSQVRRLTIARKNDSRDTVAPKVLSDPSLNHMWSYFESRIPFNTEARWEVGSYW